MQPLVQAVVRAQLRQRERDDETKTKTSNRDQHAPLGSLSCSLSTIGPGLPAPIVRQLNVTLSSVLSTPELREKLSIEALEPTPMSPERFGEFMRADIARWTKVAHDRKIDLELVKPVEPQRLAELRAALGIAANDARRRSSSR